MLNRVSGPSRRSGRLIGTALAAFTLIAGSAGFHAGLAEGAPPRTGEMAVFDVVAPPQPAPAVEMRDGDGNVVTLDDFAGHVVVLNFWATWCAPCVREMPSLDRLQAALGEQGLRVVPVSLDRNGREAVLPFYERIGIAHLGVYLDTGGRVSRAFGTRGLPTTVVLDAEGRIVGRYQGAAEWDSDAAIALLDYYLDPES
ncbi:MAG: redoxin family protein [Alphaproteobacteria bacterium]|jgi:thiol-disulfide isomerase/thioredoxin|nr:redoxin family protein [Alphaproteobacteria bacterium]